MNNKLIIALVVITLFSNVGLYMYYEGQANAQSLSKYQISYDTKQEALNIIQIEESKGCSKLHQDYTNKDGTKGLLTFTCDDRTPPPEPKRQLDREAFIQELANERNVELIGTRLP